MRYKELLDLDTRVSRIVKQIKREAKQEVSSMSVFEMYEFLKKEEGEFNARQQSR